MGFSWTRLSASYTKAQTKAAVITWMRVEYPESATAEEYILDAGEKCRRHDAVVAGQLFVTVPVV